MTATATKLEQLRSDYSDYHKEVYGCRSYLPEHFTVVDVLAAMKALDAAALFEFAAMAAREKQAIVDFETLVANTMANGAKNRETALRWISEADPMASGDWEFLCYAHGLPYGYFLKAA
jgi:hypothetical protein